MVCIGIMRTVHDDLAAVDLNLLRVLDVVLAERHVTRAAARLGLTQSAASHALPRHGMNSVHTPASHVRLLQHGLLASQLWPKVEQPWGSPQVPAALPGGIVHGRPAQQSVLVVHAPPVG
jgi:hypothetical protein